MQDSPARPTRRTVLAAAAAAALGLAVPGRPASAGVGLEPADELLVVKSERRLYLLRGGVPIKSYRIALGLSPVGHKEHEGDFRTPEGRYRIDGRNAASEFYLSLHVSYPSPRDLEYARAHHWQPGGSIMIHGLPNVPKHPTDYYRHSDWTNGCIALSNTDMLEVWLLTRPDMPIEIRP